jgi:hypothetical protein
VAGAVTGAAIVTGAAGVTGTAGAATAGVAAFGLVTMTTIKSFSEYPIADTKTSSANIFPFKINFCMSFWNVSCDSIISFTWRIVLVSATSRENDLVNARIPLLQSFELKMHFFWGKRTKGSLESLPSNTVPFLHHAQAQK